MHIQCPQKARTQAHAAEKDMKKKLLLVKIPFEEVNF